MATKPTPPADRPSSLTELERLTERMCVKAGLHWKAGELPLERLAQRMSVSERPKLTLIRGGRDDAR